MFDYKGYKPKPEWNELLDTVDGKRFFDAFELAHRYGVTRLFLSELFTAKELSRFINRVSAAYWIDMGTPYSEISSQTGMSSKAIAQISKKLRYGEGALYKMAHEIRRREKLD